MTLEIIRKARIDAILEALKEGIKDSEELIRRANKVEKQITDRRGTQTERRFKGYAKNIVIINSIRPSNNDEEELGIDFWIAVQGFKKELPVQVKSSETGIENFRNSTKYIDLGKRIVVLNTGPRISIRRFETNLYHEIYRIKFLPS